MTNRILSALLRRLRALCALLLVLAAPLSAAGPEALTADQAAVKSHVMFLASDAMKGREAGSPEFDIAAQYVAAQFMAAGLKPGGDDGYLQRVPLVSYVLDGVATASVTTRAGSAPLAADADWTPTANPTRAKTDVSAPVVFVGQGIVAPAYARDDYAGIDVRGKIVALVPGAPTSLTPEERAYFGSVATKAVIAAAHGAVGVVQLTAGEGRSGAAPKRSAPRPRVTWANGDAGFSEAAGAPLLGTLTSTGSARLFAGAPSVWKAIAKASSKAAPAFRSQPLPATLTVSSATRFTPLPSENVIGVLPGSDPKLAHEVVVLSAHLDHLGVTPAKEGDKPAIDRINNGALDDAIGIATLIEEAKRLAGGAQRPKRTVLFLAVTAEEKGLVGSSWFAHHPSVPKADIVADVNLDMPILFYPFRDLVAFGGDRSTLGPIIARAASSIGVTMAPDPIPEQGIFVRSDHFNFVRQGVPSIFLWPGPANGGKEATEKFLAGCYHHPCDEVTQPILWDQAVRFIQVNERIAREIADAPERPRWNKGDYFGTTFGGPIAE